jgi:hypothetical protein
MSDNSETPSFVSDEMETIGIHDAVLSPAERFRRRRLAVAGRCARRPPKTLSGQLPEHVRAVREFTRRRRRRRFADWS